MKTIGVLTSGGDSPGMNAAVRAVVRSARFYGMKTFGIKRGYQGLIDGDIQEMGISDVSNIIQRGGTMLLSARCQEFKTEGGQATAIAKLKTYGIQGLVVVGGDGSFAGAQALSNKGIPTIGIPGTIDNDLGYTEFSLGFDTACNTVLDAINKLRDTMESHERVLILEVMGRRCGDIALHAGLAGGAEAIIVPEVPVTEAQIVEYIKTAKSNGKGSCLILLAEGAGNLESLKKALVEQGKFSVRTTVLGHIQRGGGPTMQDRRLGTMFGVHAVNLLKQSIGNRIVGIKSNKVFDMDINEGLKIVRPFDKELYDTAMRMSKSLATTPREQIRE